MNTITILFENEDIVAINKPSGLMVHAGGKKNTPTLADWILERYPHLSEVGEAGRYDDTEIVRPGIVHRLDEETSGVLIVAKTKESYAYFKQQFKDRLIEKEYHAFVWGHFKEATGTISAAVGRSADPRRRLAGRGVRGQLREAVTSWSVIEQFFDELGDQFSFVQLFPKTGRTHQLRVHMKYIQRPICSDHLYAPYKREALGFSRVALHARKISFTDRTGSRHEIEAPYPADFKDALAKYHKAC